MTYYNNSLTLEQLYSELGITDYNLEVLQSNVTVLQEARNELLMLIQEKLTSTEQEPSSSNVVTMASRPVKKAEILKS